MGVPWGSCVSPLSVEWTLTAQCYELANGREDMWFRYAVLDSWALSLTLYLNQ